MDLIAKCRFPYLTRHLVAGEAFQADDRMGRVLVKIGRAELAPRRPAGVEISPPPSPPVVRFEAPPAARAALEEMKASRKESEPVSEASPSAPQPPAVVFEPVKTEQEPAPALAEAVVPEAPSTDEPMKPAYKSTRRYGSKAP